MKKCNEDAIAILLEHCPACPHNSFEEQWPKFLLGCEVVSSELVSSKLERRNSIYDEVKVVVKVEDKYISFETFRTDRGTHWNDLGIDHDLLKAHLVNKKERTVTETYYE